MKTINDLPPEILRKCFRSLSPPNLKSSVLVSSGWRAVGEDPSLWTWCKVIVSSREDLNKLSVRRLSKVRIWVKPGGNWDGGDWEALWQALSYKELPQLEEVDLWFTELETEQITSILTRMAQEDIKVKKLDLGENDLSDVEPEVLARGLIKLEDVALGKSQLRLGTEQITTILGKIAREDTKPKKLNLAGNDLFDVEPEALVRAVVKLEEVDLGFTNLSTEQITSITSRLAQEDTKLKKLNLCESDLSDVEPEVLARGLIKLEEVDLSLEDDTEQRTEQITTILATIAREDTKLKKLNLEGNDLSDVEPEALVRAVVKLEVDLGFTHLTTEQITSILTRIAQEDTKLKKLHLWGNDVSEVEPEALVRAMVKLEELNLGYTHLSTVQITSLLTTIAKEDTKLKKLHLTENNLSDVEPEVLAKGLIKLENYKGWSPDWEKRSNKD